MLIVWLKSSFLSQGSSFLTINGAAFLLSHPWFKNAYFIKMLDPMRILREVDKAIFVRGSTKRTRSVDPKDLGTISKGVCFLLGIANLFKLGVEGEMGRASCKKPFDGYLGGNTIYEILKVKRLLSQVNINRWFGLSCCDWKHEEWNCVQEIRLFEWKEMRR